MRSDPPKELLSARPVLDGDPTVAHPDMGLPLGSPPRKYTRAVHERIVLELRKGQRPQGACARAGITLATFHDWVRRGKSGDPWLFEFAEDVEIAYNEAEAGLVDVITEATEDAEDKKTGVEAAKWLLERTRADGYSKQVKALVDKQIEGFMIRLEKALEPHIFEKVLAVYLGQAVAAGEQIGMKEAALLPEHGEEQE